MRAAPVWVFDLDNTLHDATPHIFPHINRAMTRYLMEHLALDEAGASALRQLYWQRYGATLLGLVRHHGTDPRHFLWHTHQFPELSTMLVFQRGLRHMLRRLPGRKVVFSNSPAHYSRAVLRALRILDVFDAVFSIEHTRLSPKPRLRGFLHVLRSLRVAPSRCIMVEDSLDNLRTARRLGMKTVWVTASRKSPPFVDASVRSVLQLPRVLNKL
ncbi:pyrimidine 5'-nucleotidase [Thiobacter aerophilum]|uniref:Pyrimidine 5'-nucleotidase n=1 Tax=Thiobacter aerophilum TaxID=3121275 RepID=A0ABV0EE05_9BURK